MRNCRRLTDLDGEEHVTDSSLGCRAPKQRLGKCCDAPPPPTPDTGLAGLGHVPTRPAPNVDPTNRLHSMFANTSFAATRRQARSSVPFHLLLLPTLFLLVLLYWTTPPESIATTEAINVITREDTAQPDSQRQILTSSNLKMRIRNPQAALMKPSALPLRVITFNIRYATNTPVTGEQPWSVRCPKLCRQLIFNTAGQDSPFICLQEALHSQVHDIQRQLGPEWSHIGRGRDEDPMDGEFSPVFYKSDTWECIQNETKWLSETPDKPSRGWDAALNRIVTMGLFRHRGTGSTVVVMSTHVSSSSSARDYGVYSAYSS